MPLKATAKTRKCMASNINKVMPAKRAHKAKQPAPKQLAASNNNDDNQIMEDLEEDKGGPGKKTPAKGKRGGRVAMKTAGEAVVKHKGKAPQYVPPPAPSLHGLMTSTARCLHRRRPRSRG